MLGEMRLIYWIPEFVCQGLVFFKTYDKSILPTQLRYVMPGRILKTDTFNLRISRATKAALRFIADREKRSMSNMIDCFVADYFTKNELPHDVVKRNSNNAHNRIGTRNTSPKTRTQRKGADET